METTPVYGALLASKRPPRLSEAEAMSLILQCDQELESFETDRDIAEARELAAQAGLDVAEFLQLQLSPKLAFLFTTLVLFIKLTRPRRKFYRLIPVNLFFQPILLLRLLLEPKAGPLYPDKSLAWSVDPRRSKLHVLFLVLILQFSRECVVVVFLFVRQLILPNFADLLHCLSLLMLLTWPIMPNLGRHLTHKDDVSR